MNKLPQVLQNEIWEYVRGDRAYWKQIHSNIVNEWFPAFRHKSTKVMITVMKTLAVLGRGCFNEGIEVALHVSWGNAAIHIGRVYGNHLMVHRVYRNDHTTSEDFDVIRTSFLKLCREVTASLQ